jgi:DNA-directed RNA polymerase specialized sigma24 family protein
MTVITDAEKNRLEGAPILEAHAWEAEACREMGIVIKGKTRGPSVEKAHETAKPGTHAHTLLKRAMQVYYAQVCAHDKSVSFLARRFVRKNASVTMSEAYGAAQHGLIRGLMRWNPEKGAVLTYVTSWIHSQMQRSCGILARKPAMQYVYLHDDYVYQGVDLLVDDGMEDRMVVSSQIAAIRENIGILPEKQQYVILGMLEGANRKELADKLGVSKQYVDQLFHSAATVLAPKIDGRKHPRRVRVTDQVEGKV